MSREEANILGEIMRRLEAIEDQLVKRRQIKMNSTHKPRQRWNAKLNPEAVQGVRALLALGYSQHRVAAIFRVSRAAIQAIAEQKTWKYVA